MNSFEKQEKEIAKSIMLCLKEGKVVGLGAESSVSNKIYRSISEQAGTVRLEDGGLYYFLKDPTVLKLVKLSNFSQDNFYPVV